MHRNVHHQRPSGGANDVNGMPILDSGESRPLRLSARLPWRLRPPKLCESTVLPDCAVDGRVTDAPRDLVLPGASGYTTPFGFGASAYRAGEPCADGARATYSCVPGTTGAGAGAGVMRGGSGGPRICASEGSAVCACSGLRRCGAVPVWEDDGEASVDCNTKKQGERVAQRMVSQPGS